MPGESVKVMVRVRPMNTSERASNCKSCLSVDEKINIINLQKDDQSKEFTFDNVFTPTSLQQYIYETSAFQLVESVAEGYNGTIFAYGQTGCGKTFTMMGIPSDETLRGIIPRSFSHIVNLIESARDRKFLVRCSYLEIYNEEIHDLLSADAKARRELKESTDKGIFIKDLTMCLVKTVDEMERNMNQGNKNRATAETQMNKDSSRSHSIFTLYIESSQTHQNEEVITAGKLNLVDLAGSERQSKTQATGDRLKEGSKINLSLSALGNVISALVDGKSQHIPYRDSKLTRLLQDSLGGNTKTIMIAAISPADYNYEESLSTLRYASRAKFIKNQPKINEDPKDALLKEFAEEIKRLKQMISSQQDTAPQLQTKQEASNQMSSSEMSKLQKVQQQISEDYQKQLRLQEETVERERAEKAKLEAMIKELEQKTIQGGVIKQESEQQKKYKQMQSRLKAQYKEQDKLKQEKEQKENELNFMEKNYQSLQEEVDGLKNVLIKMKQKYKQALNDIDDINRESEQQREDLLETIRIQEKELKLYQCIIKMLVSNDELETLKSASEWNGDCSEYYIPPFYLKEKKLKFPKLGYQQG